MLEKKTNTDGKMLPSSKCSCCPYGFHIDRDFVRFCDSLYNSAQLDKLRQHKREKRKEKKTVESYLGLGNILAEKLSFPVQLSVNTIEIQNIPVTYKTSTLPHNLSLQNDGLENAMQDFEETWQKSLKRSYSSSEIILKRNGIKQSSIKPTSAAVDKKAETFVSTDKERSRNSSTSSASSQSTAISCSSIPVTPDVLHEQLAFNPMTSSVDGLPKNRTTSPYNSVGMNRTVLCSIRDRIASSLQRMKELEDQVKTIPVLKVKLYALSEEKKSLLNQLRLKSTISNTPVNPEKENQVKMQLTRLENEGVMSPTLTRKCLLNKSRETFLSSPGITFSLDANLNQQPVAAKEVISSFKTKISDDCKLVATKTTKNASTSCSILTRDIGTGYVPNKNKSVAVGNDITFQELIKSFTNKKDFTRSISLSSESLESDSESLVGSDEKYRISIQTKFQKVAQSRSSKPSGIPIKSVVNTSTNTDVKYYYNKYVNTDQSLLKAIVIEPNEKICKNKSVSVSPLMSSKSVQVLETKNFRSVGSQTVFEQSSVIKRDVAVGDSTISDVLCAACKKTKRSIAVGDFNVKATFCDKCSSPHSHSGPNSGTLMHSGNCENCVLRQTETVGIGDYDVNDTFCQNCIKVKSENVQQVKTNSTGTNTLEISSTLKSDMHICDKCSATIHSVAQGFASNISDSKIPRPNLKVSPIGKTNHTKLAKLRIQVSKSQKKIEMSPTSATPERICIGSETLKSDKESSEYKRPIQEGLTTDFTNIAAISHKKVELSKEVKAACKVLNDYLQKPERGGEKKTLSSLTMIQNEWFRVANQKKANPLLIEDYLDAFEEFSKLLLNKVVNLSDNNGNTALHYAISYGNFDVVSILIDSKVCDVNKKNKAGYTSIMLVALADMKNDTHHYVVQRIFSIGDINIKATQNGQTALMIAASHGKKDIVKILLDAGAEVNLQDRDGSTALMCAAEHGHLEIVKLLLSHPECDPTIVDNDDCNALTIAMEAGHKDIGLLIYTNMNFSRGSSPYSTLKTRKRSTPRSTPPPRTPTLRTPPPPSPSARSTNSIPASFQFPT